MKLQRRTRTPSAFAWLLGATGAAAIVACSASSGTFFGQSGGAPLGGPSAADSTGSGQDASVSSSPFSDTDTGVVEPDEAGETSVAEAATNAPAEEGGVTVGGGGALVDATPDAPAASAMTFTLLDTTVTTVVQGSAVKGYDPIAPGATINLAVTGSALSIRANPVTAVGSIGFALDATYTHTENTTPYTLCSDDGQGTVTSCANILTPGKHTLTATPYSEAKLGGTAGTPATLDFTISDTDAGAKDAGAD